MSKIDFGSKAKELVSKMTLGEKMAQMRHEAPAIARLNIPAYNWWNECLHGVARGGTATVFPQPIAMAATFNRDLIFNIATAISDEARAKNNEFAKFGETEIFQGLTYWSPNINIFRDPRWGRGHETYGEDPYLTATIATEFIKGLQGDDENYRKVDATLKHYAVHSGPEIDRHSFNAIVSDKDLYETYLWAFKYCIKYAGPAAVMCAYNRINGEAACGSQRFLKDILYDEFGFDGYVVSDCAAIVDINENHKITETVVESAALAVNMGCQLNCGEAYKKLLVAYDGGLVDEETIDKSVIKLIKSRLELGLMDNTPYEGIMFEVNDCEKHHNLSKIAARESIVMLKNNGVLPIDDSVKKIAVIGHNADDKGVLLGNYYGTPSTHKTFLQGIKERFSGRVFYSKGCDVTRGESEEWVEKLNNEAVISAKNSDLIILILGLNTLLEGEAGDAYNSENGGDKWGLELPDSQKTLWNKLKELKKPIIFVNVSGSAINLSEQQEFADCVVQVFYPGQFGGIALAEILWGDVNPTGKLPVTFYKSDQDLPDFRDYAMTNRTYKYFQGEPLYPFGFGLSYAKCEYRNLEVVENCDFLDVAVELCNLSNVPMMETVEIYVSYKKIFNAPKFKLIDYKKITVDGWTVAQFKIGMEFLSLFDDNGKTYRPKGEITVYAGGSLPTSRSLQLGQTYIEKDVLL